MELLEHIKMEYSQDYRPLFEWHGVPDCVYELTEKIWTEIAKRIDGCCFNGSFNVDGISPITTAEVFCDVRTDAPISDRSNITGGCSHDESTDLPRIDIYARCAGEDDLKACVYSLLYHELTHAVEELSRPESKKLRNTRNILRAACDYLSGLPQYLSRRVYQYVFYIYYFSEPEVNANISSIKFDVEKLSKGDIVGPRSAYLALTTKSVEYEEYMRISALGDVLEKYTDYDFLNISDTIATRLGISLSVDDLKNGLRDAMKHQRHMELKLKTLIPKWLYDMRCEPIGDNCGKNRYKQD